MFHIALLFVRTVDNSSRPTMGAKEHRMILRRESREKFRWTFTLSVCFVLAYRVCVYISHTHLICIFTSLFDLFDYVREFSLFPLLHTREMPCILRRPLFPRFLGFVCVFFVRILLVFRAGVCVCVAALPLPRYSSLHYSIGGRRDITP